MGYFTLIVENLLRKPIRTFLTFFSLFVAFILFVILGSVTVVFTSDLELEGGANRIQTSAKYSIIDSLPGKYVQEVQAIPGVELVTHASWFGGYYQEESNQIPVFPVDPSTYFEVLDELEISDEALTRFIETRRSMVAPKALAAQYGWTEGDIIPIGAQIYPMNDGSMTWEFELVGTYSAESEFGALLINYFYFDEARQMGKGSIGWLSVKVADSEMVPEIATQIDEMYENSSDPTRSAPESEAFREFLNQYGNIGLMMTGILSAVFFTILLLTANTMTHSFRERISELAVLKTVGFSDTRVATCILLEAILLCLTPALISILFAIPVAFIVEQLLTNMPMGFPFALQPSTILGTLVIAVVLGCLVGFIPSITAKRLTIVEAHRN